MDRHFIIDKDYRKIYVLLAFLCAGCNAQNNKAIHDANIRSFGISTSVLSFSSENIASKNYLTDILRYTLNPLLTSQEKEKTKNVVINIVTDAKSNSICASAIQPAYTEIENGIPTINICAESFIFIQRALDVAKYSIILMVYTHLLSDNSNQNPADDAQDWYDQYLFYVAKNGANHNYLTIFHDDRSTLDKMCSPYEFFYVYYTGLSKGESKTISPICNKEDIDKTKLEDWLYSDQGFLGKKTIDRVSEIYQMLGSQDNLAASITFLQGNFNAMGITFIIAHELSHIINDDIKRSTSNGETEELADKNALFILKRSSKYWTIALNAYIIAMNYMYSTQYLLNNQSMISTKKRLNILQDNFKESYKNATETMSHNVEIIFKNPNIWNNNR